MIAIPFYLYHKILQNMKIMTRIDYNDVGYRMSKWKMFTGIREGFSVSHGNGNSFIHWDSLIILTSCSFRDPCSRIKLKWRVCNLSREKGGAGFTTVTDGWFSRQIHYGKPFLGCVESIKRIKGLNCHAVPQRIRWKAYNEYYKQPEIQSCFVL